jgi:hypothetical protein
VAIKQQHWFQQRTAFTKITASTCYPFKVISTGSTGSYILLFHVSLPILKASLPHHFVRMLYVKLPFSCAYFQLMEKIHSSEQSFKFWEEKTLYRAKSDEYRAC